MTIFSYPASSQDYSVSLHLKLIVRLTREHEKPVWLNKSERISIHETGLIGAHLPASETSYKRNH